MGFHLAGKDEYKAMCVKFAVREELNILNSELQASIEVGRRRAKAVQFATETEAPGNDQDRKLDRQRDRGGYEIG